MGGQIIGTSTADKTSVPRSLSNFTLYTLCNVLPLALPCPKAIQSGFTFFTRADDTYVLSEPLSNKTLAFTLLNFPTTSTTAVWKTVFRVLL